MKKRLLIVSIAAIAIVGCTFPNVVSPYKLDIPQGNIITEDQIAQLKPGMTRSQVRFILGSPMLTDPFHADRWDYVYTDARNSKLVQNKKFTVFFEQGKLARFEGEALPAARPLPALNAGAPALQASAPANKKD